jgi:hypothetical protein
MGMAPMPSVAAKPVLGMAVGVMNPMLKRRRHVLRRIVTLLTVSWQESSTTTASRQSHHVGLAGQVVLMG